MSSTTPPPPPPSRIPQATGSNHRGGRVGALVAAFNTAAQSDESPPITRQKPKPQKLTKESYATTAESFAFPRVAPGSSSATTGTGTGTTRAVDMARYLRPPLYPTLLAHANALSPEQKPLLRSRSWLPHSREHIETVSDLNINNKQPYKSPYSFGPIPQGKGPASPTSPKRTSIVSNALLLMPLLLLLSPPLLAATTRIPLALVTSVPMRTVLPLVSEKKMSFRRMMLVLPSF
ncbi:hypothetical protein BCR33DRAFT_736581 [Rhizoclosmatium globosum]|uniref:Uncharacterized protein n=1 Tax=Rhizoclosmatium globosum TaxID=329046 RepID=A0A1Y2CH44_9FUNG|nr:hypothetical protein BCR33DRAFT_736581 [Rhizoclosmatium globosum]|eukprot:ORY46368.1 hypothetical protein BCR33DRAFT_736581 [Rhizoclosmatium globosum]